LCDVVQDSHLLSRKNLTSQAAFITIAAIGM